VGTKFLLSPKIDAQLSQRTEGRLRDKSTKKNVKTDNAKDKAKKPKVPEVPEEIAEEIEEVEEPRPSTRRVPDVDLIPKRTATVTEPVKVNQSLPKEDVTYKNRAPVEVGLDIEKIVDSVMEMEVTVPLKSLAGVSGAIQKEIRKQVTKARMPVDIQPQIKKAIPEATTKVFLHDLKITSKILPENISPELQEGCVVGGDPVLQLLEQRREADPKPLVVGKLTEPLRAIYIQINGVGQEECLLDGGSMIVSMHKKVAIQLGLVWDPALSIEMESASNHVEETLGVARNVLFEVGGLKLFLQVHVLENPPYRILLGKPFEVLGETAIQTHGDGSAEVVIRDPNTKRVAVVPTYKRGEPPEELQKNKYQGF